MKVKDFIDYLSNLDPENDIWIVYDDGYRYVSEPDIIHVYNGQFSFPAVEKILNVGDYIFDVL